MSCVWAPAYVSTKQHLHGVNYSTAREQMAYRRRSTALEIHEKRQRQKHADHGQQFTRAQFLGGRFPAKFRCQPIKLELYPLVHTQPANYMRVHFSHLGVYKESQVAHRAIRVRVS